MGGGTAHRFVGDSGQRPQHRQAGDAGALFGRVIVQQAQHDPALLVDAGQQTACCLTRAHHDGAADLHIAAGNARAGVLVDHAVDQTHQRQAHQGHHRVQRQHCPWHLAQVQHQYHHGAGKAGQQAGQG